MRAVAVLAVVLFHVWPRTFPGGFVGVDCFFVISGFLITRQLLQESAATGRISLVDFWARRIRRLLPAALTVLTVVLVVLVLVMPPVTWHQNLGEVAASAGYVENWLLGFDAVDYLASEQSPSMVQHYWSLAVEEQFYLVWPLLLAATLALGRSRHTTVRWVLGLVLLGSLGASIAYTPLNPALAFFATPLRAWEFAAGGLLSVLAARITLGARGRAIASWVGWTTIVALTILLPGSQVQFPGWIALVPVTAAVLCLAAGDPDVSWGPRRWMHTAAVRWAGDCSYSLYLWHWPLIVLAAWVVGPALPWWAAVLVLGATVALAAATRRFIEQPIRLGGWWRVGRGRVYGIAAAATAMVLVVSLLWDQGLSASWRTRNADGMSRIAAGDPCFAVAALIDRCPGAFDRPTQEDIAFAAGDLDKQLDRCQQPSGRTDARLCQYGARVDVEHTIAVVGNSHALRLIPALDLYGRQHHWRILLAAATDCLGPVVDGPGPATTGCQQWSRNVERTLLGRGDVDAVIFASHVGAQDYLAGRNASAADVATAEAGVATTFRTYRDHGLGVVVTGDVPGTRPDDAPSCVARSPVSVDPCARPRAVAVRSNTEVDVARAHPELASYLSLEDFMCDSRTCHAVIGGVVVYSDSHHLSTIFSRSLGPYLGAAVAARLPAR